MHKFKVTFYKIPVVNDFFKLKIKNHLGKSGLTVLEILNPDKLPLPLRTNFYIEAVKVD